MLSPLNWSDKLRLGVKGIGESAEETSGKFSLAGFRDTMVEVTFVGLIEIV